MTYHYDAQGLLTHVESPDDSPAGAWESRQLSPPTAHYAYDPHGRLVHVLRPDGVQIHYKPSTR